MANHAEIRERLKGQQEALSRFLQSSSGKEALAFLEIKFGGAVHEKEAPYSTHVRIGERNVVDYLKSLAEDVNA